jgi:hypothetical protein
LAGFYDELGRFVRRNESLTASHGEERMTFALAGLLAGFVHVFTGPDHLAAIAPYAVDGKSGAWRTGVRWGLGHASGVLGVALLALALRDALPVEALSRWGERFVGLALFAIGIWGLGVARARYKERREGVDAAARPNNRSHATTQHAHGHAAFAVGTLHGLAGSSHLLGILPALALPSDVAAGVYLLLFGTGSVAAMGTFSSFVGWLAGRAGASGARMQSALIGLSSALAVAVGIGWMVSVSS